MTAPIPVVWHGLRVGWWCALLELVQHGVVYGASTASPEAAVWVAVAFLSYGAAGGLVGAALDVPLRSRPGVAVGVLAVAATVALAGLNHAVLPTAWAGPVAGALAYTRWRWPGQPSRGRTAFRLAFFGALGAAALAWLVVGAIPGSYLGPDRPRPTGPNVVVVVLDTVRQDHVSAYGYGRPTTPTLDALAAAGTRWDGSSNAPWSLPSHATIVTGLYAGAHGAHDEGGAIAAPVPTVQELLGAAGYDTLLVTGNPWLAESNRIGAGFATRVDSWGRTMVPAAFQGLGPLSRWWNADHDKGGAYGARRFRRWLDHRPDPERPFFALVNIIEAHAPYHEVPAERFERFLEGWDPAAARDLSERLLRHHVTSSGAPTAAELPHVPDLYDGAVSAADAVLDQWIAALDERAMLDDTVVIVTADHGEYLGEHGLWGHLHGLYEPVLRVPMVVHGPGFERGGLAPGPGRLIDVAPTVLEVAGVAAPSMHGRPLGASQADDPVIAEQYVPFLPSPAAAGLVGDLGAVGVRRRTVRVGSEKLHLRQGEAPTWCDLATDPGEQHLRPADAAADRVWLAHESWTRSTGIDWPEGGSGSAGAEALDRAALKALGYAE